MIHINKGDNDHEWTSEATGIIAPKKRDYSNGLRQKREQSRITLRKMSEITGESPSYICALESGGFDNHKDFQEKKAEFEKHLEG